MQFNKLCLLTVLVLILFSAPTAIACHTYDQAKAEGQLMSTYATTRADFESRCATTRERSHEIYDACILAKMPRGGVEREVKSAIKSTCRRKACKPSFLDKLRF